jgi:hypothetical protein
LELGGLELGGLELGGLELGGLELGGLELGGLELGGLELGGVELGGVELGGVALRDLALAGLALVRLALAGLAFVDALFARLAVAGLALRRLESACAGPRFRPLDAARPRPVLAARDFEALPGFFVVRLALRRLATSFASLSAGASAPRAAATGSLSGSELYASPVSATTGHCRRLHERAPAQANCARRRIGRRRFLQPIF